MILGRCEFGKEDYSLNIINLPVSEQDSDNINNGQNFENISVQALADKNEKNLTLFD
jgi:hypothetical protein